MSKPEEIEVAVFCPHCHALCILTKKNAEGDYEDSCWRCGYKFPKIRVTKK